MVAAGSPRVQQQKIIVEVDVMYRITGFKKDAVYHLWFFPPSCAVLSRMVVAFVFELSGEKPATSQSSREYLWFRNGYRYLNNGREIEGTFSGTLLYAFDCIEQCAVINLDAKVVEYWKSQPHSASTCIHEYDIPFDALLSYSVYKNIRSIVSDAHHGTGVN